MSCFSRGNLSILAFFVFSYLCLSTQHFKHHVFFFFHSFSSAVPIPAAPGFITGTGRPIVPSAASLQKARQLMSEIANDTYDAKGTVLALLLGLNTLSHRFRYFECFEFVGSILSFYISLSISTGTLTRFFTPPSM